MKTFINAIKSNNLNEVMKFSKSDIHNHATRGGNIEYVLKDKVEIIPKCPNKFLDLHHMQAWYDKNIKPSCLGVEGFERRIKGAFYQAKLDGITHLTLSFGLGEVAHYGNSVKRYIERIEELKNEVYPEVKFYPELCFLRNYNYPPIKEDYNQIFELNYFRSIDLVGDESIPVDNYIHIFKKAKEKGLITKAHVGEFSDFSMIEDNIIKLDLNEVQHGINAVHSKKVMQLIKDRNITLNICPTSNVALNAVKNYASHPIGKLFRFGISVTINSDDMLIFNKSVSEEYLELYNAGVLTPNELDKIRMNGIRNLEKLDVNLMKNFK